MGLHIWRPEVYRGGGWGPGICLGVPVPVPALCADLAQEQLPHVLGPGRRGPGGGRECQPKAQSTGTQVPQSPPTGPRMQVGCCLSASCGTAAPEAPHGQNCF